MLPNRFNSLIKFKLNKLFKLNQLINHKSTINQNQKKMKSILNNDLPYFTTKKFKIKKLTKAIMITIGGSYLLLNISSNYSRSKHLELLDKISLEIYKTKLNEQTIESMKLEELNDKQQNKIVRLNSDILRKDSYLLYNLVLGINLLIYLLWQIPSLQSFMFKYFTINLPTKNILLPLIFSTFSHRYLSHLFLNMLPLFFIFEFDKSGHNLFSKSHILVLYMSLGMFASLTNLLIQIIKSSYLSFSCGSSSAILGILFYHINKNDYKISISKLDNNGKQISIPIDLDMILSTIFCFNLIGFVAGWKFFNFGANLAACVCAILFSNLDDLILEIINDHEINKYLLGRMMIYKFKNKQEEKD